MAADNLYQQIIMDHFRRPRHYEALREDEVTVQSENPNCGDRIRLALRIEDGRIASLRFDGEGCALCIASTSLMAENMQSKSVKAVCLFAQSFVEYMIGEKELDEATFGQIAAFNGVRFYPMRVKCATLAWQALLKALKIGRETS